MNNENKKRLYALLSRKFFLAVGLNIAIITIITVLFTITVSYTYNNGTIVGRVPMLGEDAFVKIIQALLFFNGTYLGVNMLQKWGEILGIKLNGNSKSNNNRHEQNNQSTNQCQENKDEDEDDDI